MSIFGALEELRDDIAKIRDMVQDRLYPIINDTPNNADLLAETDNIHNRIDDAVSDFDTIIQDMQDRR